MNEIYQHPEGKLTKAYKKVHGYEHVPHLKGLTRRNAGTSEENPSLRDYFYCIHTRFRDENPESD